VVSSREIQYVAYLNETSLKWDELADENGDFGSVFAYTGALAWMERAEKYDQHKKSDTSNQKQSQDSKSIW